MAKKPAIWIDFENAPHVWVFSEIIRHFEKNDFPLFLTARDFSYTVDLCRRFAFNVKVIAKAGGERNSLVKVLRVLDRSRRLLSTMAHHRKKIGLALSFSSRSQTLSARALGLPIICLEDYEFSEQFTVRFVNELLVPFPIPKEIWGKNANRIAHLPGLKEELYLCRFKPVRQLPSQLSEKAGVKILFRPEGRFTHYRSEQSAILQMKIMDFFKANANIILVLLPRDNEQAVKLTEFCIKNKIRYWIPETVMDGPSLIWHMDMVIGGGGTMTREASVLGIPSYTFFAGKWGAVDEYLRKKGSLVRLGEIEDIDKMNVTTKNPSPIFVSEKAFNFTVAKIEEYLNRL
jgi:hypothetical protein